MNSSLSTFMKIAVTVIVIVALLFTVGYKMIHTETTDYTTKDISGHASDLSTTAP